jgi:hypothetical protein
MFCSYPSVEGEDPQDFYCTYSKVRSLSPRIGTISVLIRKPQTDGSLVEDHNANACPKTAVNNCGGAKRRTVLPRSHPANHARDSKPDYSKDRRNFEKRRLTDSDA